MFFEKHCQYLAKNYVDMQTVMAALHAWGISMLIGKANSLSPKG